MADILPAAKSNHHQRQNIKNVYRGHTQCFYTELCMQSDN